MDSQNDIAAAGEAIRQHRLARQLSQEQLAERSGLHRNYIGLLERGERNASLTSLFAIAAALDLSLSELFADLRPAGGRNATGPNPR